MIFLTFLRATKSGLVKRVLLLSLVFVVLLLLLWHLAWAYRNFESGLGTAMAQIAITYHVVLLTGMIAVGVGLGYMVNRMIREKQGIFRCPRDGGKTEKLMKLWGYELENTPELLPDLESMVEKEPVIEMIASMEIPTTPRRGRKPTFTLDRWIPIAVKWENRDPIRDAFTLGELIAEHLGTNPDGSPIVSEQTYYSVWRKRAIDEIQRRAACKKPITIQGREKERA